MGDYARVKVKIWHSSTFSQLSNDAKLLWLYLLTCPHGNMLGCFILKKGYMIEDLQWSKKRLKRAFGEILNVKRADGGAGLVAFDADKNCVLIHNYM